MDVEDFLILDDPSLTFGPGVRSNSITIDIIDDSLFEERELFTILLSRSEKNLSLMLQLGFTILTIADDDKDSKFEFLCMVGIVLYDTRNYILLAIYIAHAKFIDPHACTCIDIATNLYTINDVINRICCSY